MNWDRVIMPKYLGGLGIQRLKVMNKTCLMKLEWSLRDGVGALWVDVLIEKYARE
jgi:hypothetical protein